MLHRKELSKDSATKKKSTFVYIKKTYSYSNMGVSKLHNLTFGENYSYILFEKIGNCLSPVKLGL